MSGPRPQFGAYEAVQRALAAVGHGVYELGTGNADSSGEDPRDCCGFATCECYGIVRHRPGFNVGSWSTCSDDINCNASIEDALHEGDLFEIIFEPEAGALLKWPTIHLPGHPPFTGHECIVVGTTRAYGKWDRTKPDYRLLDVVQCAGPNGRHPGILATDGGYWYQHDLLWPKPEHRSWMLRVKP